MRPLCLLGFISRLPQLAWDKRLCCCCCCCMRGRTARWGNPCMGRWSAVHQRLLTASPNEKLMLNFSRFASEVQIRRSQGRKHYMQTFLCRSLIEWASRICCRIKPSTKSLIWKCSVITWTVRAPLIQYGISFLFGELPDPAFSMSASVMEH